MNSKRDLWAEGWEVLTNVTDDTTEVVCRDEDRAHAERRWYIANGSIVSLVAYDPSRDGYVFNVWYSEDSSEGVTDDGTPWQSYRYDGPDA